MKLSTWLCIGSVIDLTLIDMNEMLF